MMTKTEEAVERVRAELQQCLNNNRSLCQENGIRKAEADGREYAWAYAIQTIDDMQELAALTKSPPVVSEVWQPIETAPHACHFMAARFEGDWGEWTYSIVMRDADWENLNNWTHWQPLPEPPPLAMSVKSEATQEGQ